MSENTLTPAQILLQTADEKGNPTFIPRDVYKIRHEMVQETKESEALALYNFLKSHEYEVRYSCANDVVDKVFATHKTSIERATRFPHVIIIDATYKTAINRMPLVNIVGIDNISSSQSCSPLRSFYIGSALVTNEKEASYEWMLRQLQSVVFDKANVNPGIFVTDDDKALGAALRIVYPNVPYTLCAWHIRKNFEKNTSGCFIHGSDDYIELSGAIDTMLWSRNIEDFNNSVATYRKLINKTKKSKELNAYIDGYIYTGYVYITISLTQILPA